MLEVTDTSGRRAVSSYLFVYCYKQGLYRCGDNLNTLGPTGMIWHPDRNQMLPMAKPFYNAEEFRLDGVDGSPYLSPIPQARWVGQIQLKGVGRYPDPVKHKGVLGPVMEYTTSNHNVHIATMRMTHLSERHNTAKRPRTAMASDSGRVASRISWGHSGQPRAKIAAAPAVSHRRPPTHRRSADRIQAHTSAKFVGRAQRRLTFCFVTACRDTNHRNTIVRPAAPVSANNGMSSHRRPVPPVLRSSTVIQSTTARRAPKSMFRLPKKTITGSPRRIRTKFVKA